MKGIVFQLDQLLIVGLFMIIFLKIIYLVMCYVMWIIDGSYIVVYIVDFSYQDLFILFLENVDLLILECNFYVD